MNFEDFVILKKKIHRDGELVFNIASDSMVPLININDKIIVTTTENYEVFDLIVFWEFDRLICHFVVNQKDQYYTSSLKEMRSIDYPIKPEFVLGKVSNYKLSFWQKTKFLLMRLFT